jgi:hypothetical protein
MKDLLTTTNLIFPFLLALVIWFVKRIIADFDKKHDKNAIELKTIRLKVKDDLQATLNAFESYKLEVDRERRNLLEYSHNNKKEVLELNSILRNAKVEFKVLSESFIVKLKNLDFTLTKVTTTTEENKTNLKDIHGKILTIKKISDETKKNSDDNRKLLKRHNTVIVELKNKVEKK